MGSAVADRRVGAHPNRTRTTPEPHLNHTRITPEPHPNHTRTTPESSYRWAHTAQQAEADERLVAPELAPLPLNALGRVAYVVRWLSLQAGEGVEVSQLKAKVSPLNHA